MEIGKDEILYQLYDTEGKLISESLKIKDLPEELSAKKENCVFENYKNVYRSNELGAVRLVFHVQNPELQGTKAAQRACKVYLSLVSKFKQLEHSCKQKSDVQIRRFSHNLIKFQSRFKGNFSRLIPDKARSLPYDEFKAEVQQRISNNISSAAHDVAQMSNRAVDLDAQIETLRILCGFTGQEQRMYKVNLNKAMHRITNAFLDELSKKDIRVLFNIKGSIEDQEKVPVIHSYFNVAIWQLFDNISKYTLPKTDINLTANLESNPKTMSISMTSVCIDEDELEVIFRENRQGRNVNNEQNTGLGKDGMGIGMFVVRKALRLMGAKIEAVNSGFFKEEKNHRYCNQCFLITFKGT